MKNYLGIYKLTYLSILLLSISVAGVVAQPGTIDPTFNVLDNPPANPEANDGIYSSVLQSNGKILIGGNFTHFNDISRTRVARLNEDGSVDSTFDPGVGPNFSVRVLALQADGKIIIAGDFNTINGVSKNKIARLNADGTLDSSFDAGTGPNNKIESITVQSDGKIIITGYFTFFNGFSQNRLVRLNINGTIDTSFSIGSGLNSIGTSTLIQPDGKIVISGAFTTYNGISRTTVVRVDANGAIDPTFNPSFYPQGVGEANSIALLPDGKLIVAGNKVVRLNTDGTTDRTFIQTPVDHMIYTMNVSNSGSIYISGSFDYVGGIFRPTLARLNANGSFDNSFDTLYPGSPINDAVTTILPLSDERILISGFFTRFGNLYRNRIARLNNNGSLDTTFSSGTGANNEITTQALQLDGKIVIAGLFTAYNGIGRNYIARINSDGSLDTTFDPGSVIGKVSAVYYQPDGKIVIGGNFTSYNGTPRKNIVRINIDGSLDASFNPGAGFNSEVKAIDFHSSGKIIVGGWFSTYNGQSIKRLAVLNNDGSLDTAFNPGTATDQSADIIVTQPSGDIIIGGNFQFYNGVSRNRIVRIKSDGTIDTSFNPGTGFGGSQLIAIALQADGKILAGGSVTSFNGVNVNQIARLNVDGTLDISFNPSPISGTHGSGTIFSITSLPEGVIIGGNFKTIGGISRQNIARLNSDGSLDISFDPGSGTSGPFPTIPEPVYSTFLQPDGKVVIAGSFTRYNGVAKTRIARLFNLLGQTVTFNALASICPNSSTTLNSSSSSGLPITYTSSNPSVATVSGNILNSHAGGTSIITATQTGNSIYNSAYATQAITVYSPTATVTPNGPTTFCSGGSIALIANPGTAYLWSTGDTTQSINVSTSGSYSVEVTNASGCQATSSPTNVTVNPNPTVSINGPSSVCGSSASLTASGGTSYIWNGPGITNSTLNPLPINQTGSYYVTTQNSSGCQSVQNSIYVSFNSVPSISISGPSSSCSSATLTASGGSSYSWSGPGISGGGSSKTVHSSGWYYVTGYSAAGCTATASKYVIISYPPSISISQTGGNLCSTGYVNLHVNATAGSTYYWYHNGATTATTWVDSYGSKSVLVTWNGCSVTGSYYVPNPNCGSGGGGGKGHQYRISSDNSDDITISELSFQPGVYPNPVDNELNVVLEEPVQVHAEITFTELSGKVLATRSIEKGDNKTTIVTGTIPDGIYILAILSDSRKKYLKVIVRHGQ